MLFLLQLGDLNRAENMVGIACSSPDGDGYAVFETNPLMELSFICRY